MYLDDGYDGHGFYGLTSAAEGYFGVQPAALTWSQASLLAGLFQAPSAYDPFRHPDAARTRQEHVLEPPGGGRRPEPYRGRPGAGLVLGSSAPSP